MGSTGVSVDAPLGKALKVLDMNINKLGNQFIDCLAEGLVNKYVGLEESFENDGLYAYVLYCASGFAEVCVAVSTESSLVQIKKNHRESENELLESLKEHPDLLADLIPFSDSDLYAEMTACEWEHIYDIPEFEELDSIVDEIYEFSDGEADMNFDVSKFLTNCIVEAIKKFQSLSAFDSRLLTGIQFADPSELETKIVEKVSSQVNSHHWHEKLIELQHGQTNS